MAHYAFLNENNIVTEVITGRNEWEIVDGISNWEEWYGNFRGQHCVRVSINNKIRKQFPHPGYTYNEEADVFVAPQPFASWQLDVNFDWQPPVPMPELQEGQRAFWDEESQEWRVE